MDTSEQQETARRLVAREVNCCLSSLVSTLAGHSYTEHGDLLELMEQAAELAAPVDDWEEAAIQDGWSYHSARMTGNPTFQHAEHGTHMFDGWQDLCQSHDIEPYDREVFEHWAVSNWLADALEARGEKVDRDFAGLNVWARTTTGQAI